MAYQSASATDINDLLDRLRLFLEGAGWSIDFWNDYLTGKALCVSRAGHCATFRTSPSGGTGVGTGTDPAPFIGVRAHAGYTGTPGPTTAVEASPELFTNALSGPYVGYDFFEGDGTDGPYVHIVVETVAGVFKHFGTGVLNREGVFSTGQYAHSSRWYYNDNPGSQYPISNPDYTSPAHQVPFDVRASYAGTYVRADADGAAPNWLGGNSLHGGYSQNNGGNNSLDNVATLRGPFLAGASTLTGRTQLWPLWCLGRRPSNLASPLGYPPDMRFIRLDYYNPKDVLTLGADEWKVFPVIRKNGVQGEPNSGLYGYAYRIND